MRSHKTEIFVMTRSIKDESGIGWSFYYLSSFIMLDGWFKEHGKAGCGWVS
jgi:hypothetical protein